MSGQRAVEFAHRHRVHPKSLWHWRKALAKERGGKESALLEKIVEVRPTRLAHDDRFEVQLGGGRSVGVPASFDEAALVRLLRVLEVDS